MNERDGFREERRAVLLRSLVEGARNHPDIVAAALVGSLASGAADEWSDVDLALRLRPDADLHEVADDWSARVAVLGPVADVLDLAVGAALYRVFLLSDALQLDLSFWPHDEFRAVGGPMEVLFGEALDPLPLDGPGTEDLIAWAWLHALHARSALRRGRPWQALQMLDGLRDQLIALACRRFGLPAFEGRGTDELPQDELRGLLPLVPGSLERDDLTAALLAGVERLHAEADRFDADLATRLRNPLAALVASLTGETTSQQRPPCSD